MVSKWMNDLLQVYSIGGNVDGVVDAIYKQSATKRIIERVEWLVRDSEVPSIAELVFLVNLVSRETPVPILTALLAAFVRLNDEIRVLKMASELLIDNCPSNKEKGES